MKTRLCLALWLVSTAAAADWPGLPPDETVRRMFDERPETRAAASELAVGSAQRERLLAGPYEWTLRLGGQQRRSAPPEAERQRFGEWNSALERPFRLPGKAGLDGELGDATLARARSAYGDNQHEARRQLLVDWFAWRAETAAWRQALAARDSFARQLAIVERRLALGDASRLELTLAQAAHAQSEAQAQLLGAEAARQREQLARRYPGLPLVDDEALPVPQALPGDDEKWVATLVDRSHELALAQGERRIAELGAARQRAERLPDPALGVAFSRERGGEEQVLGAFISIPLPGGARRAGERAAAASADAANQRLLAVRREVELAAVNQLRRARAALLAWEAAELAARRQGAAADMAQRAYRLGEGSLSDLLLARRQAGEAAQQAVRLQADALHQAYRVRLDAEQLWTDEAPAETAG